MKKLTYLGEVLAYMTLSIISPGSGGNSESIFVSFTDILVGHDIVEYTGIKIL